ncbi:RNA polymerase sigma factor [Roseateles sp. SL47]|uniref:RNA polymerase sigma factor n=1 Tax=Roseateles sp. SL47 TaxID=2995138 RepID=UPI00226EF74E|nr:RNA polymerase sigma factor [Roseateles sp. SL47]WAC74551.1 RNA polymerase sigma factor [Roseateles sp. SL47]
MFPTIDADVQPQAVRLTMHDLDQLIRTHTARLTSFLRRRVGNPQDVEDLVQDTLLEAVRCLDQFQGQSRPETWLFGIALNLTRNYYKRARLRDIYVDVDTEEMPSDAGDNPLEISDQRQRLSRLARVLPELPEESRQLLHFVVVDDLSYEEVAQQLSIPIGTVRSRISRARSHLKRRIETEPSLAVSPCPPTTRGETHPDPRRDARREARRDCGRQMVATN